MEKTGQFPDLMYDFSMSLLEREESWRELERALHDARRGEGRIVLLGGEAGVGKTALVERFARDRPRPALLLWGACDPLFTPRPLGPLYDMTAAGDIPAVAALLADSADRVDADRAALFAAFLAVLRSRPSLVVFEDVHWADEATLDLIRYLGRRVVQTRALLLLTYRDDELGPRHPLRLVLGDLASSPAVRRVSLPPLSEAAVRALAAGSPVDPVALHRQTGGNPFFVTEVLAAVGGLPHTIRDAVLARAARLPAAARDVLEGAAVIGARVEASLLAAVVAAGDGRPDDDAIRRALEACLDGGVLLAQGDQVAFRHDLAREAVLDAISPLRRVALHRRTLAALEASTAAAANPARLAHHAEAAGDVDGLLRHAPVAARQAAHAHAHRAAATLYRLALGHSDRLPPAERARLLEAYAAECNLIDRRAEGAEVCLQAADIWREFGEPARQGGMLAQRVNMLIGMGDHAAAAEQCREALALLEAHPPGAELAFAYRMQANLRALAHDYRAAIDWAEKSLAVAEGLDDHAAMISARNVIGTALMYLDFDAGAAYLEGSLNAARAAGRESTAVHAYTNLGSLACEMYRLRRAERYLSHGIALAAERDLDRLRLYMLGWWAMTHLRLGRWDEAVAAAEAVLAHPGVSVPSRVTALSALGLARARRGDPDAAAALDEALALARPIGYLHRLGLVAVARAEAAWLAGDATGAAEATATVYEHALEKRHAWFAGELAYWLWRGGRAVEVPDWTAEPFRLEIDGDWRGAAAAWKRLRCPYEQARALAGGDTAARLKALTTFESLGARPAAESLRRALRDDGVARVPRGPRPATRDNPFGLTNRQVEVLAALVEGLTNAEIAARFQLSPKTVDHHVSAVLGKLDVRSREEAAELARRSGLAG